LGKGNDLLNYLVKKNIHSYHLHFCFQASNKNLSKKRFITSKETKEDGTKENEAEKLEDDISENLAKKAKIDNT